MGIRERRKVKVSALRKETKALRKQGGRQQQMEQALLMAQKQQEVLITALWDTQHAYATLMQATYGGLPRVGHSDDDDTSDGPSMPPGLSSLGMISTPSEVSTD